MSSPRSPRASSSEHLLQLNLRDHYEIVRDLGRGTYGKVVLAKCLETGTNVALKVLPKSSTKLREFQREFQYSYFLSPHMNIVDSYNVAFETRTSFVFAQEYAPVGDLFDAIPPQVGMKESEVKLIVKQIASALEFMHSKQLVHRDIKPENILIFEKDFNKVKLMDFGMTRKDGTVIRKTNGSIPYTPPEICEAVRNENITVASNGDVWAFGVLLFCMLTGNFPWENADIGDIYFSEFVTWLRKKSCKIPSQWKRFTPKFLRFFRKALDIKPQRRCKITEICKYLSESWLLPVINTVEEEESPVVDCVEEEESVSDSESEDEDNLAAILHNHGIDTKVDKRVRDVRISEWLLSL